MNTPTTAQMKIAMPQSPQNQRQTVSPNNPSTTSTSMNALYHSQFRSAETSSHTPRRAKKANNVWIMSELPNHERQLPAIRELIRFLALSVGSAHDDRSLFGRAPAMELRISVSDCRFFRL